MHGSSATQFSAFLAQFLGGPAEDTQLRWWLSLRESHLRFKIEAKRRDAWLTDMTQALDDVQIGEPVRTELLAFFAGSSAHVVNHGKEISIDEGPGNAELSQRWEAQIALDEAVAVIRGGDANRAIGLAEGPALRIRGASVRAGLLAQMVRSGESEMLDCRTLLHEAAAAGSLPIVELLLSLGADPRAQTTGGHTALYCVGNECMAEGAEKVVRALVLGGVEVDACDGVKHCTALHMAARRGNAAVTAALLDCGANREARDSLGDTPLRRAVNCKKAEVVSLLVGRGADVHSPGSKEITPMLAAKTPLMKRLLQ